MLFHDVLPAGYLFGANRPSSNTTWEYGATRSGVRAYIKDPDHRPGTVFEMKAMYAHRGCIKFLDYSKDDPLPAYINSNYNLVCETAFYRVYTERSTNWCNAKVILKASSPILCPIAADLLQKFKLSSSAQSDLFSESASTPASSANY